MGGQSIGTVARAQIGLAYLYAGAFLLDLTILLIHPPELTETAKIILLPMLGWLGALVQQHSSYFFARQRPDTDSGAGDGPPGREPGGSSEATKEGKS